MKTQTISTQLLDLFNRADLSYEKKRRIANIMAVNVIRDTFVFEDKSQLVF